MTAGYAPRLILASASPRRVELLARIGIVPDAIIPADVDESVRAGELPHVHVNRLAFAKAAFIAALHPDTVVLAADTIVVAGRRILPKADNEIVARACLEILSGRRHHVLTAVAIMANGAIRQRMSDTLVKFKSLTRDEIERYCESGEWRGKAGGYAIQGYAESFVSRLSGSHSGVVGLPLFETRNLLLSAGIG